MQNSKLNTNAINETWYEIKLNFEQKKTEIQFLCALKRQSLN